MHHLILDCLAFVFILTLAACRPTPLHGTSSGGAGGGPAETTSSSSDTSSGTGGGAPACVEPRHRPADYACANAADCNTGTQLCEAFTCEKERCIYRRLDDGAHCDPGMAGEAHWSCAAGACCPRPQ